MKWILDQPRIADGGDCGGDYQATDAYQIRYRLEGDPCRMVSLSFYGVATTPEHSEVPTGRFDVECQTEFMICTDPADPGGSEVWCDYTYRKITSGGALAAVERADELAKAYAMTHVPGEIEWDGEPR